LKTSNESYGDNESHHSDYYAQNGNKSNDRNKSLLPLCGQVAFGDE